MCEILIAQKTSTPTQQRRSLPRRGRTGRTARVNLDISFARERQTSPLARSALSRDYVSISFGEKRARKHSLASLFVLGSFPNKGIFVKFQSITPPNKDIFSTSAFGTRVVSSKFAWMEACSEAFNREHALLASFTKQRWML